MSNIQQTLASATSTSSAQIDAQIGPEAVTSPASEEVSLIFLEPRSSGTPITSDDEEDVRRCWVCYSTEAEDIASGDAAVLGEWKSPCRCSLVAHEKCLLNWIASEFQKEGASKSRIECPQCKTRIRFKEQKSLALDMIQKAMKVANATVPIIILCGLGSAVIVGCTVYGVNSIYLICGTKFANKILLGSNNSDFQWTWRLAVGLPLIPFVLIGSRTRSLDATLPVLPFIFFCHRDPLHFSIPPSPAVTLALLPYLRGAYYSLWDRYLKPHEVEWSKAIEPVQADEQENINEAAAAEAEDARDIVAGGDAVAGGRQGRQNQQGGWQGEVIVENHNIMVHGSNVTNTVVGALLLPSVSALMGGLLGRIPAIRRALPEAFHRNILGGCLFVVLKDVINLYYKFKRAQQHRSRVILNYRNSLGKLNK